MQNPTQQAQEAISSMIERSQKAKEKFAPGTSQHTLQKNRIQALCIALALLNGQIDGHVAFARYTKEDLKKAVAPIASLLSKSEKAQTKLKETSWQYAMLQKNIAALKLATPLLAAVLETGGEGPAPAIVQEK